MVFPPTLWNVVDNPGSVFVYAWLCAAYAGHHARGKTVPNLQGGKTQENGTKKTGPPLAVGIGVLRPPTQGV